MLELADVLGLVREPVGADAVEVRLRALGLGDDEAGALLDASLERGQAASPARGSRAGFVLFHTPDDRFVLLHARDPASPQTMALHELANAMTLVAGLAERALHAAEAPVDDPRAEMIDRIARTARDGLHVARLVERSDGDASVSERRRSTRGEVLAVLGRVLEGLVSLGSNRDVRLRSSLTAVGSVANEHALAAISWNLIKNAIEASPGGSFVDVTATNVEDTVVLEVLDAGVGIDGRPVRKRSGRGVGLAVARALVESLSGTMELRPREPRGTIARVVVPVKMPSTRTSVPSLHEGEGSAPDHDAAPRQRIVVIEDDATLRRMVSEHLAALGWAVETTEELGDALHGEPFDLALLDMNLGEGLVTEAQLATLRATARCVVAMTGDPVVTPQVDGVLRKPFELEELVDLVSDLLGPPLAPSERAHGAR